MERLKALASSKVYIAVLERFPGGTFTAPSNKVLENMPPFCRLRLIQRPASRSYIVTEFWLPDEENWNGRFLGTGTGGLAGLINFGRLGQYLRVGYAVANSDLGTSRGEISGIGNPEVWADFGWRATHLMAVYGKRAVKLYYGRPAVKNYFAGNSTGGQQALSEAQRFPRDFDGILAGVPALNRIALHTYFLWNWLSFRSSTDGPMFSEDEAKRINECAVSFFRENGGAEPDDCFVSLPWIGDGTPQKFVAYLKKKMPSLTEEQAAGLEKYYSGPLDSRTGKRIYCGVPIGSEINPGGIARSCNDKCQYFFPFIWTFGAGFRARDFDFGKDYGKMKDLLGPYLNANSADLSEFAARGGKMIGFSGSADPTVPYPESLEYYDRVAEKCGGYDKAGEFFRYYVIPGRAHNGGMGAEEMYDPDDTIRAVNALRALERWVEEGHVPCGLTAVGRSDPEIPEKKDFERTIYPYGVSDKSLFTKKNRPSGCDESLV